MAGRGLSFFVSRIGRSSPLRPQALSTKASLTYSTIRRFGSAAEPVEEPLKPPVQVQYTQLLIDGKLVDAASGDLEDVNRAVKAARKAFDEGPWPKMTAYERACIMYRFADLLEKHNDDLAALETWDNGKPYEQARRDEMPMLRRLIRYYAGELLGILAGLPPGVLNIVSGYGPTAGAAVASHMDIDKLAFTGSTVTGQAVLEAAARSNLKPVTLELGGKSPFIICGDADIDQAVEQAHFALFFNQGQCCCAGSRTFVHESIFDEFVEKSQRRALRRVVGDPFRKNVEQGPQIDQEQFDKIMGFINAGKEEGAALVAGGERIGTKGFYIQPTVFADVQDGMSIAKHEIFGPVQSILKFKTLDEVIKRANATHYGLAAGVYTKSLSNANTLTRALRAGTVWVNCYDVFDAAIPFGGYKMSGHGREKSIYSLQNYLQVKAVVSPVKNPAWL